MTNAEIIQAIKAEIERRITDNTFGAKLELIDILAWLDTLESEKPINQEELEKELRKEIAYFAINGGSGDDTPTVGEIARHFAQWGAEWQAKQDQETIELAEDHAYFAGAVNEREKIMKEAVCYIAQADITATGNIEIPFIRIGYTALSRYGIKVGDKVRIIIIKEDER